MQALYKQIDGMGYEELPASIYAKWLDYLDSQKEKSRKDNSVRINGLR
jgi:hypothetical protein